MPKLVYFNRSYVENFFLQYFYGILIQEAIEAMCQKEQGEEQEELEKTPTTASVLTDAITAFTDYLRTLSLDELAGQKPLEIYRVYRQATFNV